MTDHEKIGVIWEGMRVIVRVLGTVLREDPKHNKKDDKDLHDLAQKLDAPPYENKPL